MAYPKIEGERLDIVLQKLRDKGEATPLDAAEAFEALLNGPGRPASPSPNEARLIDYTMPPISDPNCFVEHRVISALEYLRDTILPQWNESPEMTRLATRVIEDELQRYQDIRDRRQSGIAA